MKSDSITDETHVSANGGCTEFTTVSRVLGGHQPCGTSPLTSRVATPRIHRSSAQVSTLIPVVYDELRHVAARYLNRERPGHTLQPTALVNEVFVRLVSDCRRQFAGRTHFVAVAALSMRQILVERARARCALKRGQRPQRVALDDRLLADRGRPIDVIALDEALGRLGAFDAELARIVEFRYFVGFTIEETAEATNVSTATVKRQWAVARAWLKRAIQAEHPDPARVRPTAPRVPHGAGWSTNS